MIYLRQAFFIYLLIRIFLRKLHHHTSRRSDDLPSQRRNTAHYLLANCVSAPACTVPPWPSPPPVPAVPWTGRQGRLAQARQAGTGAPFGGYLALRLSQVLFLGVSPVARSGRLSGKFVIEKNFAHTFWGLRTRVYSKLTALTLCIYINRLLGKPDFLQIKALAFPIYHKVQIGNK